MQAVDYMHVCNITHPNVITTYCVWDEEVRMGPARLSSSAEAFRRAQSGSVDALTPVDSGGALSEAEHSVAAGSEGTGASQGPFQGPFEGPGRGELAMCVVMELCEMGSLRTHMHALRDAGGGGVRMVRVWLGGGGVDEWWWDCVCCYTCWWWWW